VSAVELSVVMVTHGAWEWTERALSALAEHTPLEHEVVVIDNASPDETPERLRETGVDAVLLDRNLGFSGGCNLGARRAGGRHLCFLNPDALVTAGWLEPLQAALDGGAGAAGPRLLYPRGDLQEAGSLIARDGRTAAFGEGADPTDSAYRFPREVDYVSAACVLIGRRDFWQAGGFDPGYGIAYYEDADLCLSLTERGRTVRYVPESVVLHAKRASGSELDAEEQSERNRQRFVSRWGHRLGARPLLRWPPFESAHVAARDALAGERVLIALERLPAPGEGLLGSLAEGLPQARLTVVACAGDADPLLARGIEATADRAEGRGWVEARSGHYDVVVGETAALADLSCALDRGQPWAPRLRDPAPAGPELAQALAPAGVALALPS